MINLNSLNEISEAVEICKKSKLYKFSHSGDFLNELLQLVKMSREKLYITENKLVEIEYKDNKSYIRKL